MTDKHNEFIKELLDCYADAVASFTMWHELNSMENKSKYESKKNSNLAFFETIDRANFSQCVNCLNMLLETNNKTTNLHQYFSTYDKSADSKDLQEVYSMANPVIRWRNNISAHRHEGITSSDMADKASITPDLLKRILDKLMIILLDICRKNNTDTNIQLIVSDTTLEATKKIMEGIPNETTSVIT